MSVEPNLYKAIKLQYPSEIPLMIGILPAMWIHHGAEMERVVKEYRHLFPEDFHVDYSDPTRLAQGTYRAGTHVDEWGCVWSNLDEGMEARSKTPRMSLPSRSPRTATVACPTALCICVCWICAALKTR